MLLSRVASSLVWWHALEFSSCQKWGSCGFCSLCDKCFRRIPQPLLPRGHPIFRWGWVSALSCVQGVCVRAGVPGHVSVWAPFEPAHWREDRILGDNVVVSLVCSKAKVAKSIQQIWLDVRSCFCVSLFFFSPHPYAYSAVLWQTNTEIGFANWTAVAEREWEGKKEQVRWQKKKKRKKMCLGFFVSVFCKQKKLLFFYLLSCYCLSSALWQTGWSVPWTSWSEL